MGDLSRDEDIRRRQSLSEELHSESECVTGSDSETLVPTTDETDGCGPLVKSATAVGWARRVWSLLRSWLGSAVVLAVPLLLLPLPVVVGNDVRMQLRRCYSLLCASLLIGLSVYTE